jgi:hypothetical protein
MGQTEGAQKGGETVNINAEKNGLDWVQSFGHRPRSPHCSPSQTQQACAAPKSLRGLIHHREFRLRISADVVLAQAAGATAH